MTQRLSSQEQMRFENADVTIDVHLKRRHETEYVESSIRLEPVDASHKNKFISAAKCGGEYTVSQTPMRIVRGNPDGKNAH